jgi:hypothetical protein
MLVALQFSTESDPISAFIRWWTWSPYSHVDFVVPLTGELLGARETGGVQVRPANYAVFSAKLVLAADATIDVAEAVLELLTAQVGKPYDLQALFGYPFRLDWQTQGKWFCSDLIAWAFETAGYPLLDASRLDRVTPADLILSPLLKPLPVPTQGELMLTAEARQKLADECEAKCPCPPCAVGDPPHPEPPRPEPPRPYVPPRPDWPHPDYPHPDYPHPHPDNPWWWLHPYPPQPPPPPPPMYPWPWPPYMRPYPYIPPPAPAPQPYPQPYPQPPTPAPCAVEGAAPTPAPLLEVSNGLRELHAQMGAAPAPAPAPAPSFNWLTIITELETLYLKDHTAFETIVVDIIAAFKASGL